MVKLVASLKIKVIKLVEYLHRKIFGHEMSDVMRKFLRNLSWSFFGGIISAGILFVVSVLAGRFLGPEEYGKYNMIITVAVGLVIPMTLGLDIAASRFIMIEKDSKKNVARYILKKVIFYSVVSSLIGVIVFIVLGEFLGLEGKIVCLVICLSLGLTFKNVTDSFLRGFSLFNKQAKFKIVESLIVLGVFIFLVSILLVRTYDSYVWAILVGYIIFSLISFKSLPFKFLKKGAMYKNKDVIRYGYFVAIGAVASFLLRGSDKILINEFLGTSILGVYSAYYVAAILPITQMQIIFVNVFFPMISQSKNINEALRKIDRLAVIFFLPLTGMIFACVYGIIRLYGDQYPIDLLLMFLFSIYAVLFFHVGVRQWLLASLSKRAVLLSSVTALSAGVLQVLLVYGVSRVTVNLYYFMGAIIIANIFFIGINEYFTRRMVKY